MEIKANVFGRPVTIVDEPEPTALGVALLGGVAAGVYPDIETAVSGLDRREYMVEPDPAVAERYYGLRETGVRAGKRRAQAGRERAVGVAGGVVSAPIGPAACENRF
jgi:ribulose kinase